jgi:pimeloyl-ACP methyl ester carboxylesterase
MLNKIRDVRSFQLFRSQFVSKDVILFPGALTPPINYYRHLLKTLSTAESSKNMIDIDPLGLVVFGELDDYLLHDSIVSAQKYVKNLQVRTVKGANHFVQQDDPDTINSYIREFLVSAQ